MQQGSSAHCIVLPKKELRRAKSTALKEEKHVIATQSRKHSSRDKQRNTMLTLLLYINMPTQDYWPAIAPLLCWFLQSVSEMPSIYTTSIKFKDTLSAIKCILLHSMVLSGQVGRHLYRERGENRHIWNAFEVHAMKFSLICAVQKGRCQKVFAESVRKGGWGYPPNPQTLMALNLIPQRGYPPNPKKRRSGFFLNKVNFTKGEGGGEYPPNPQTFLVLKWNL